MGKSVWVMKKIIKGSLGSNLADLPNQMNCVTHVVCLDVRCYFPIPMKRGRE